MKLPSISSMCSIILGGIIAIGSSASFVIDITSTWNLMAIGLDLVVMGISYMTVWNGISSYIVDKIARKQMEQEWDYKVQPLIKLIADSTGRMDKIEKDVLETNLQVKSTLSYVMKMQDMDASKVMILPGASFRFISKILVVIVFTFSALVYVSEYPMGIIHYFILVIYLTWWMLLTSEYKLFDNTTAWIWAVMPIMIIPSLGMIIDTTLGLNNMIAILFFGLFIYAYSYYTWACLLTTGYRLIDLKPIVYILKNKFKFIVKNKNEDNHKIPSRIELKNLIFQK